jgi:DNA-binding NtrC family response regulator
MVDAWAGAGYEGRRVLSFHRGFAGCVMGKVQTKLVVLVVEDQSDALMALAKLLTLDGHIVHPADGYQAALDVAKRERIDLAVCDISLWDGNGCDLLKELQKLQKLIAIAVTGFALADELFQYQRAGFAAVLPKPVDYTQLTSVIDQLAMERSLEPTTDFTNLSTPTIEPDDHSVPFKFTDVPAHL